MNMITLNRDYNKPLNYNKLLFRDSNRSPTSIKTHPKPETKLPKVRDSRLRDDLYEEEEETLKSLGGMVLGLEECTPAAS